MTERALPTWRYGEGATKGSWEGHDLGSDVSGFVVDAAQGEGPSAHTHPYSETFVLLEGSGRWTAGDEAVDLHANQMLVVPSETPHGFRNTAEEPLLVVSVHESGTLDQTFLGRDPD